MDAVARWSTVTLIAKTAAATRRASLKSDIVVSTTEAVLLKRGIGRSLPEVGVAPRLEEEKTQSLGEADLCGGSAALGLNVICLHLGMGEHFRVPPALDGFES